MVDIYEMEKSQKTGKWKTQQNKLLAISMPFEHAKALFRQRGILASESKFKTLYKELNGVTADTRNPKFTIDLEGGRTCHQ